MASLPDILHLRMRALAAIRNFLQGRGFLEVDTPLRLPAPALEDHIDAEPSGKCWLRTSPELHMKRLLAAGHPRIYQIGPCFRRAERGACHLPEFTMLEWYRSHADWRDILADTVALLRAVCAEVTGAPRCTFRGLVVDFSLPWQEMTVEEAFLCHAGIGLDEAIRQDRFEEILVTAVEGHLGNGRPTVLTEYPAACSGLSRTLAHRPDRLERWELYVAGLELANACSELADAKEQRRRFEACRELRRREGREVYPLDEPFLHAVEAGMPPAAGIAIGVDRLIMILANARGIDEVVAFPPPERTS
ncbi:MAG: EF-P lysine aminoacylase GenX [Lentisphaeria bacterium]|nr:EF-P lysine aminoacylase GenX [Lentisphaeria bacterium]